MSRSSHSSGPAQDANGPSHGANGKPSTIVGHLVSNSGGGLVLRTGSHIVEIPPDSLVNRSNGDDVVTVQLRPDARLVMKGAPDRAAGLTSSSVFGAAVSGILEANCNCNCSGGNCNCNCNCNQERIPVERAVVSVFRLPLSAGSDPASLGGGA
jgi:hypothetical protein